jgi:hypothetical protein
MRCFENIVNSRVWKANPLLIQSLTTTHPTMYAFITSCICDNSIILIINLGYGLNLLRPTKEKVRENIWYIGVHKKEFCNITLQ